MDTYETWELEWNRVACCAQVLPCSKRFCHDWTVCPYSHPGEKAKRRDPRLFSYTGIACPDMKKVGLLCHTSSSGVAFMPWLVACACMQH